MITIGITEMLGIVEWLFLEECHEAEGKRVKSEEDNLLITQLDNRLYTSLNPSPFQ